MQELRVVEMKIAKRILKYLGFIKGCICVQFMVCLIRVSNYKHPYRFKNENYDGQFDACALQSIVPLVDFAQADLKLMVEPP
jgi:hypothetical protein